MPSSIGPVMKMMRSFKSRGALAPHGLFDHHWDELVLVSIVRISHVASSGPADPARNECSGAPQAPAAPVVGVRLLSVGPGRYASHFGEIGDRLLISMYPKGG